MTMTDNNQKKSQADKFREAAKQVETDDDEKRFDERLRRVAGMPDKKVCPECRHVFQGNGWDGIDAHWRSKHEDIMPYEEAWPLIRSGKYG